MELFTVGESNCKYQVICDILLTPDDETAISFPNIVVLARKLEVRAEIIQPLKNENFLNQSNYESLHCVLANWRSKLSKEATLSNLLKALRSSQLNSKADQLEHFFNKKEIGPNEENMSKKRFMPTRDTYYVPRKIIPRNYLDPSSIFMKHPENDIFLIQGIDRNELSEKAKCRTDTSANQKHLRKLTVKYMVLSFKSDFMDISKKVDNPVHWIQHKNGEYFWIDSSKCLQSIQQAVSRKSHCAKEESFLLLENTSIHSRFQPVCIADTPGMGKSYLLANLARNISAAHANRIVILADFSLFISQLKSSLTKDIKMEDAVTTVLQGHCSQRSKTLTTEGTYVEVMLDGFDEIPSEDLDLAYQCLQIMKAFPTTRLWVTTRPHLLPDLEKCLHVLGYNIRAFNREDQVSFLVKFWLQGDNSIATPRLDRYASSCLEVLKKSMSTTENHIAGIPLQCMLIGTLYKEEAVKYAKPDNICDDISSPPVIQNDSVAFLFKQMIDFKFKSYFQRHSTSTSKGEHPGFYTEKQLLNAHTYLSLQLLFPQFVKEFRNLLAVEPEKMHEVILSIGLVQQRNATEGLEFLHRLFAEYFVAKFINDYLNDGSVGMQISRLCKVIFDSIPKTNEIDIVEVIYRWNTYNFRYLAISYFLDAIIGDENALQNYPLTDISAIHCCAAHYLERLFNFIKKSTDFNGTEMEVFNDDLLLTAVMYSDVPLISQLSELYKIHNKKSVRNVLYVRKKKLFFMSFGYKFSPLHVAIRFRQYSVVEYLVQQHCEITIDSR